MTGTSTISFFMVVLPSGFAGGSLAVAARKAVRAQMLAMRGTDEALRGGGRPPCTPPATASISRSISIGHPEGPIRRCGSADFREMPGINAVDGVVEAGIRRVDAHQDDVLDRRAGRLKAMAERLREASVCVSMSPRTILPVGMSSGAMPETKTKPLALVTSDSGRPIARTRRRQHRDLDDFLFHGCVPLGWVRRVSGKLANLGCGWSSTLAPSVLPDISPQVGRLAVMDGAPVLQRERLAKTARPANLPT